MRSCKGDARVERYYQTWFTKCVDFGYYDFGNSVERVDRRFCVVETVFAWPGIGTLIVSSAQQRDFPVVMFGVLVIAASVAFINLLVDLSYGLLDPRIRGN